MGFLSRAVSERKSYSVYERWMQLMNMGVQSKAGPTVTLDNAFRVSAAFACMRVISQGLAQVPFKLYQTVQQSGLTKIEPARDDDIYDLVTTQPNGWMSSFEFRETLAIHACLGNAYVYKNIYRGELLELIILNPSRVRAKQGTDWEPIYEVKGADGTTETFTKNEIWHVRGPSWDGFLGLDLLNVAKEALGLSIAGEESHSSLHANGVRPTGVYSVDGTLDKEQHKQLTSWLKDQAAAGVGAPLVLDRSAKWISQSLSGLDAQHLETRGFEIEEVCRFFGVLPIMVGYSGGKAATYASAEQMFIAHKVHTMDPWYARVEQSADVNLLTKKQRKEGLYFKFLSAGLLRGAATERADYYSKALGAGGSPAWMTQDEVRALEELNPFGGESAVLPARLGMDPQAVPPT